MTGHQGNRNQDNQSGAQQRRSAYRLSAGDNPPPGYVLPPSAPLPPRPGQTHSDLHKSQNLSANRAYLAMPLPAYVQWPALLLPSSKPFRHYNQETGQNDTVASNPRITRQRTPTVRERAYSSAPSTGIDQESIGNTGTVQMEKSDNVDSLEPVPQAVPPGVVSPAKKTRAVEVEKDELLGTTYLGRYELVSVLGSGGMGVIYKAHQLFLERDYAIKMLKNKFASDKAKLRFHQEAKAASAINYPGIVGINDFGIDDQGRPYMVMEYVEGMTLSELQKQRPQSILQVSEALPIFIEMLEALAVAHSKGVIHRDIKPSNIMLALREDKSAHVKLLDFGIAKVRDFEDRTMQDLTKTGEALGTPLYMSPEQINSARVDNRTDLYACGCVMYMCLTGCPPFVGPNKMATMDKHLTEKPLPLKDASLGLDFAPDLEALVMKLLAKKPEDRYQSADEVRFELLRIAAEQGVLKLPAHTVSFNQAIDEDPSLAPDIPQEISQLVTEFTSLELSTACYTDDYQDDVKQKIFDAAVAATEYDRQSFLPGESVRQTQAHHSSTQYETGLARLDKPETMLEQTGKSRFGNASMRPDSSRPQVLEASYAEVSRAPGQKNLVIALSLALTCAVGFAVYQMIKPPVKTAAPPPVVAPAAPVTTIKTVDPADISEDEIVKNSVASDDRQTKFKAEPELTDKGAAYLARLKQLRILTLSDTKITDKALAALADLPIESLEIANTQITDAGAAIIGRMHILVNLSLSGCNKISDKGVASLSRLKMLRGIDLSSTQISNACVKDLLKMHMLTSVVLHGTDFDNDGLKALVGLKELYQIDLSRTKVDSTGMRYLKTLPALYKLSVAYDNIDDSALKDIIALKSLRLLEISGTKVSDKGLMSLAALPHLESISIANCDIKAETVGAFSALRPDVRVNRNPQAHSFSDRD